MSMNPRMPPADGDDSRQNSTATSDDVGNGVLPQPASPPSASVSLPRIEPEEPEPPDTIHVAAGGKLTVPREDIFDDFDDGSEMDLISGQGMKMRKPLKQEWIALNRGSELSTRLLVHKPNPDSFDEEFYHIAKALRGPIQGDLKRVRVFVYYSLLTKTFGLWVIKATPGNSYCDSLKSLLNRPASFFATNAIRVYRRGEEQFYCAKSKPLSAELTVNWPKQETGDLLAAALGPERMITSADHPFYRDLVDGTELS
jgi:hypothetical protein